MPRDLNDGLSKVAIHGALEVAENRARRAAQAGASATLADVARALEDTSFRDAAGNGNGLDDAVGALRQNVARGDTSAEQFSRFDALLRQVPGALQPSKARCIAKAAGR
jgi:hypothetical protein